MYSIYEVCLYLCEFAEYLDHTDPSCWCLCVPPDSSGCQQYSAWSCSVDGSGGPSNYNKDLEQTV